jgi:hypothetical protein
MRTPQDQPSTTPRRREDALRAAVARETGKVPRLLRTVVVDLGPAKEKVWQVGVHEFHAAGRVVYAWHDTSKQPPRVVLVDGGPSVRSAEAAVQVAVAREAAGES